MAEYLVELGIDSMSLNPDTVLKTTERVLELEQRLASSPADSESASAPRHATASTGA